MTDIHHITLTSLHIVIAIIGMIAIGVALRVFGALKPEADESLFHLTINLLMPCLILDRMLFSDAFADLRNVVLPPLLGFACVLVGTLISWLIALCLPRRATGLESMQQVGTFAACAGLFNYGFVPIPMLAILFPEEGGRLLGILFVQNLGVEIAMWTVTILMVSGRFQRDSWKKIVNGPTVTIAFALLVHLIVALPGFPKSLGETVLPHLGFFRQMLHMLGSAAIPVNVLMVGATIAGQFEWSWLKNDLRRGLKISFWSSLIRLVLLPWLMVELAIFLPVSLEVQRILVIHGAMASAVFPIVLTRYYHGDSATAFYTIMSNTLFSIVTVPLWIGYGLKLIG